MANELKIRRFKIEDQPEVWQLHKEALQDIGSDWGPGEWDNDFNDLDSAYIKPGGEFLVGIIENKIVAMGALKKLSDTAAEIKRMRVNPAYQKRGFGQAILSSLEKRALELGFSELQLDTGIKQIGAQRLYEKNGYKEFKREYLSVGETIFYRKKLAS